LRFRPRLARLVKWPAGPGEEDVVMTFHDVGARLVARTASSLLLALQALACTELAGDPGDEPIVTELVSHLEDRSIPAGGDLASAAVDYLGEFESELSLSPAGGFIAMELPDGFEGIRRSSAQQTYQGLAVVGSTVEVRAGAEGFVGFSGTLTRNLDGFDVEPAVGRDAAADIARQGLDRFIPISSSATVLAVDLVILPPGPRGADLAWQVEMSVAGEEPAGAASWQAYVDARSGAVLTVLPASGGCSLWDRLKCELLPFPAKLVCLELACGGGGEAEEVCGDGVCAGDETDASCREDCGCSATSACDTVAPYGCWCDSGCADSGDCCSDASTCYLPPVEGEDDGTCEWGEKDAGFFDRAKLTFYRAKYFAIAEVGGVLKDAPEARDLLLHYLGNSGTDVNVDVNKMLAEIPSFAEKVKQDRTRYGVDAAKRAKDASATGAVTSAIPDETLSHSVEQAESYNWWAAIHRFEYKHVGQVTVTPSGDRWAFEVSSRIVLRDRYDWDPDAPNSGPAGAFDQGELDELNCYGWAQEFWCTGMSDEGELRGVAP